MKTFSLLFIMNFSVLLCGQISKTRNIAWVMPSKDTRINGIAGGLIINSLKETDSILTTEINGLTLELLGVGLLLPIAPSDPLFFEPKDFYKNDGNVDSIVNNYNFAKYRANGIVLSGGGIAGHNININGLNLSIINTLTGKMNGLSASLVFNISGVVNGVSIGGLANRTIQTKGLQIGIFNTTKRLRGIQIGLWNVNEKRSLPIINWNFSRSRK